MKQYLERVVTSRADMISEAVVKDFHTAFFKEYSRTSRARDHTEQPVLIPEIADEYPEETIESLQMQVKAEVKKHFNFKLAFHELEKFLEHVDGKEIVLDHEPVPI